MTVREYWLEFWWILPTFLYAILLVVLIRRRKWRTGQKITFLTTCVIIIYIPVMHSPFSYFTAAAVVIYLLLMFRVIFKPGIPPNSSDR